MTPSPQEIMMGNLYPVAETAAVAIAGVAASASVAAAAAAATAAVAAAAVAAVAAAAAVMCNCECTVMHIEGNGRRNSGYIVSYVQRGESVQKTTADRHSQHLLLVWSKQ